MLELILIKSRLSAMSSANTSAILRILNSCGTVVFPKICDLEPILANTFHKHLTRQTTSFLIQKRSGLLAGWEAGSVPVIATETPRPRRHKVGGDLSQGPAVDAFDVAQFRGLQIIGLSATLPNVQLLADSSTAPEKKALWWLMCPLFQCQYQADKLQRSRCT